MRHVSLGSSGLRVSAVGLGCNNFGGRLDARATRAVVDAALDAGITLLDTADIYGGRGGSESHLGQALKGRRDQVVLATKFGYDGVDMGYGPAAGSRGGRAYIRRAVEESLRRLETDHIDLYQLHSPDPDVPIAETLAALTELVTEGKVRYIGHSNLSGWQLTEAAHVAREIGAAPFVSAQNEWSLLQRSAERELVPAALHHGVGVLPYFPLANGLLTGKIRRGAPVPPGSRLEGRDGYLTDERLDTVEALAGLAEKYDRTVLELAIGWLSAQPGCASVIAGATSAEQVRANAAVADRPLEAALLAEIDAIDGIGDPGAGAR
ncbi:aldo/keto reductase [Streptomyces sp. NBC_00513]|uniref:aldo/keto reductase n=1 Tax=unclassified Streptomyces TaxID=2593676 RepID=UPI002259AA0D|nr:aldo/keto reductase [Streptomyces sp. NBC_00424]MCX5072063.1 aldo/keto reductase [Streptomyces sp. NBC_00424]WUD44574.1 aldo/keto reductase [Streptomyces sp. NBC_00513]